MFLILFFFSLFQVLSWAVKIAIGMNVDHNVQMVAIILIRSGIAAVVIMLVVWNARGMGVNRTAILE